MRRLSPARFAALLICGLAAAPLYAQVGRARLNTTEPPQQEQRPEGEPLHVPAVDPALEAVLQDWHEKTRDIKKLQGKHRRWIFEATFQVAKVSTGKFYHEAPDKGRIDIEPEDESAIPDVDPAQAGVQIKESVSGKIHTLKPDEPEKWICDGKRILKINDAAKTYELIKIPPAHQGANIMDGPLPFLFGLPPAKAKQRYSMTLVTPPPNPNAVYLVVTPLKREDTANWQRADVMLDKTTYLPTAVKLLDPSGNRVTLFSFGEHKIDAIDILAAFGVRDPFNPSLGGYKQVQGEQPQPIQLIDGQGDAVEELPSVVGLAHGEAKTVLGQRGFREVTFVRDTVPSEEKFQYKVKSQSPPPKARIAPGQPIVLTLYVTAEDLARAAGQKAEAAKR